MAASLFFHLTGGAANADPDLSLGGTGSSVRLSITALNNLFDSVNPDEIAGVALVEYRAIDLVNEGDAEARNVQFYLTDTPNIESRLDTWYDSTGTQSIPDESTEPAGASWTQPLAGAKESLGNLAVAGTHRIWVRRTVDANATNINDDTGTFHTWFS